MVFLYVPLGIVVIYAFNDAIGHTLPIAGLHDEVVRDRASDPSAAVAWRLSTRSRWPLFATSIALLLGSAAAFAASIGSNSSVANTVSFLLVLPIALPGIVTAIALNSSVDDRGMPFGIFTIAVAHATFCIVVVYNNVLARLRRMSPTR